MAALRSVKDPSVGKDVITAGMIRDLKIDGDAVAFRVVQRTPVPELENHLREAMTRLAGATALNIKMESLQPGPTPMKNAAARGGIEKGIPGVRHIIAVSSGKGGVGKSTVAANLATALAKLGASVGLLDSDVYGPNIPTMMGVGDQIPHARQDEDRGEMIIPLEAHGVKIMSMGILSRGDQPLVWRGPMLHGVVSQFLMKVDWGQLDYLVVDMPPGTGDVQLSLTQLVSVSGAVVVTTPQEVALQDVRKAILMFEKVGVPVLGIVENMSYFVCGKCDERHDLFGTGGGRALAEKFRVPLLAEVPLAAAVREAGDSGAPIVASQPDSLQAKAFLGLASNVRGALALAAETAGTESGAPKIEIGEF
jgi:ATP-binding protein involved in chromosome partitioning